MLIQELLDLKSCIECKHNKSLIGSILSDNYGIKNCSESIDYLLELELLNYIIDLNWEILPSNDYTINDNRKYNYTVRGVVFTVIFNYKKEYKLLPDCSYKVTSYYPEYNTITNQIDTKQEVTLLYKNCNEVKFCNYCFEDYLNKLKLICKE